jgi:hypothetical protein
LGCASARPSASSSAARSGPAHAGEAGDAVRRRLGAMRGREGVVHVDIAQPCHFSRQCLVVLLFALVETAIFEQHDLARLEVLVPRAAVHPVTNQRYLTPEELRQPSGDGSERIGLAELPLGGPTEVRGHHHRSAAIERIADRRDRSADARVVGDRASLDRHVEVDADEDAAAREVEVLDRTLRHARYSPFFTMNRSRSTQRFE